MNAQGRSGPRVLSIEEGRGPEPALRAGRQTVGAIRAPLLALVALALLAAGATYLVTRGGSGETGATRALSPAPAADGGAAELPSAGEDEGRRAPVPDATAGRIGGRLNVPPGEAPPERWELHVSPSRYQSPPGTLQTTVVMEGQLEFAVDEIPFGAYDLLPVAPGWNANTMPIVLGPESPWLYVTAVMTPAGTLSGELRHADGTPMDRIEVRVTDLSRGGERTTRTDLSGRFAFERLEDGEYEVGYGERGNPVFEPRRISFRAPSMQLPPLFLEGLGQVTLEVVDEAGNPIPDVQLAGSGERGGTIDVTSDENGMARIAGLPAGEYRVWGTHPDLGRDLEVFEVEAGGHAAVRFVFAP